MTTLAYKDGIVAYDGLSTAGDMIVSHNHDKKVVINSIVFVYAGTVCEKDSLISAYLMGEKEVDAKVEMFVINSGEISVVSTDEGKIWEDKLELTECYALGSGREYAMAAMDAGLSAKEAVKIASKRDLFTGGKIRTVRVK